MLKVKSLGQNNPNNKPILSGITFGFIGMPLFFEVKHEKMDTNLTVEMNVVKDEKKDANTLESKGVENNVLKIQYFNPSIGTSGLTQPMGFVLFEKEVFAYMFYIDYLKNSQTYRLTYEFYHGQLPK